MHVLLVEPSYRTRYPPLGLLKLASYHRLKGDTVELVKGCVNPNRKPDLIYVTSLFTWAWKPVWNSIEYYKSLFPDIKLWLGGIYASVFPEHARKSGADCVHVSVFTEAEDLMPAYDLVPEWDGSIIFSSRGCDNHCAYCSVWRVEGSLNSCKRTIRHLVYPEHTRIIIWDNNILQSPYWRDVFEELIWYSKARKMKIDFNQGLDARLVTEEAAEKLSRMNLLCVRIAYDSEDIKENIKEAISRISAYGVRRRSIFVYTLYNFNEDPESLFRRIKDVLNWGAVVYPMRYEPLNALNRWKFISSKWDTERLELVEDFRRVYGYGGTFPPYHWLAKRFMKSKSFDEAFRLPTKGEHRKRVQKPYYAKWHNEGEWRGVMEHILSKRW